MFTDRRKNPRYPVLVRTSVVSGAERFDAVCTDTSPTGAFFTTRSPPQVGAEVTVEVRAGGVDSPIVFLDAVVVRMVTPGSPNPVGFGVCWRMARCELGPEPLFRVLRQLLRLTKVGEGDLTQGRTAEYVFRDVDTGAGTGGSATPRGSPSLPHSRPSSVHQARGVWSPPVHRVPPPVHRVPNSGQPDLQDLGRGSAQHPVELEPESRHDTGRMQTLPRMGPPPGHASGAASRAMSASTVVPPPQQVGFSTARRGASGAEPLGDRSQVFDSLHEPPSMAVARTHEQSGDADNASQSWPVYALAPGERRPVSQPEHVPAAKSDPALRPQAPTARQPDVVFAQKLGSSVHPASPQPPPSLSGGFAPRTPTSAPADAVLSGRSATPAQAQPGQLQPASQPFNATMEATLRDDRPPQTHAPAQPPQGPQRRQPDAARMLHVPDVPVTFLRRNQFVPARLVGLAEQLAALVTSEEAPDLDEVLVIHLPVRTQDAWRTVHLTGKLLQIPADTPDGKRFVMHIERLDEGRHKGAFKAFLAALSG